MHQSKNNPEIFKEEVSKRLKTKVIILGIGEKYTISKEKDELWKLNNN